MKIKTEDEKNMHMLLCDRVGPNSVEQLSTCHSWHCKQKPTKWCRGQTFFETKSEEVKRSKKLGFVLWFEQSLLKTDENRFSIKSI